MGAVCETSYCGICSEFKVSFVAYCSVVRTIVMVTHWYTIIMRATVSKVNLVVAVQKATVL